MAVVRQLLLSTLLIHTTFGLTGPPAAQPPDVQSLQRSFHEDVPVELKRVIITKLTTKRVEETTVKPATESEFTDNNFSQEVKEDSKERTTVVEETSKQSESTVGRESSTESVKTTVVTETTERSTESTEESTTESTTESTVTEPTTEETRKPKRLEIKKIVRTTTSQPPPEDRLTRIEELRLLKKLSQRGIAFGVKTKELELIHNAGDELKLPPFAFSEDENVVEGGAESESFSPPSTTAVSKTTAAPTTKKPVSTTPTQSDIEFLEKELARYKEEPFKVGTNVVPQHLFFDQNSMGIHKRRKLAGQKKLDSETTDSVTIRVPAMMQPFVTSLAPRVDDFLVPRPEELKEKADDEQKLDSFTFPTPRVSKERTTMSPLTNQKKKLPEKMVLPILLEMPHLSSLSSFGSLSAPVHPSGVSQRIHSVRLDSDAQVTVSPKNKTSGRMIPKRRRRLFRRKTVHAVTTKPLEGVTVPKEIELIERIRPPRIIIKQHKEKKTVIEKRPAPIEKPISQHHIVLGSPKIIRTHDIAAQEQAFAQSLTSRGATMDLVVDSLKKMKRVTRLIMKKNHLTRARARSGGKTVQLHSHDGERKAVVKVDGNTDDRVVVVDRDPSRKTVDRDV